MDGAMRARLPSSDVIAISAPFDAGSCHPRPPFDHQTHPCTRLVEPSI